MIEARLFDEQNPFGTPLLICVDMQQEYVTPGRRHEMAHTEDILASCREILDRWRSSSWPVAHLKRVARAAWFNPASSLTDWMVEWRPQPGEIVFEHPLPSAFSSSRFSEYFAHIGPTSGILIGFSLDEAILSTVIDGYHRGHSLRVVTDAVACIQPKNCELKVYKEVLLQLVQNYAMVGQIEKLVKQI